MDYHQPVLLQETLEIFNIQKDDIILDCTLGHGGHTQAFLEKGALVYGVDQDPSNLEIVAQRIKSSSFFPVHDNFSNLLEIVKKINRPLKGVLFDLGLNSFQQKANNRGFSFNDPLSLDMRLDPKSTELTAEYIINTYDFVALSTLLSKTVQEKLSKPIAMHIIKNRQRQPIKTGQLLASIIKDVYQKYHVKSSLHPATKTFLALRIEVNHELENISKTLVNTLSLNSGTKVIWISFHSGEDRLIKNFIRQYRLTSLTPKPITPSPQELIDNPLSRSSILRSYKIN